MYILWVILAPGRKYSTKICITWKEKNNMTINVYVAALLVLTALF